MAYDKLAGRPRGAGADCVGGEAVQVTCGAAAPTYIERASVLERLESERERGEASERVCTTKCLTAVGKW